MKHKKSLSLMNQQQQEKSYVWISLSRAWCLVKAVVLFFVLRIIEINDFFVSFASIIALFLIFLTKGMPATPEVRFISSITLFCPSTNPSFSLLPSLGLMISSNGGKLLLLKYLCYYLYWMLCSLSSSD